jgi:hypothetical protein
MLVGAIDVLSGDVHTYILETLTKKDIIYKKFSYHPWANNKFQNMFKDLNITWTPINECNIKNLIKANYKDKEPSLKKSGIYKSNCKQCENVCIGQKEI